MEFDLNIQNRSVVTNFSIFDFRNFTMKKNLIRSLTALLVLAGCLLGFYPITVHESVSINHTLFKISEQFQTGTALSSWYLPFAQLETVRTLHENKREPIVTYGENQITTSPESPFDINVVCKNGKDQEKFLFTIRSKGEKDTASVVSLHYNTTYLGKWFTKNKQRETASESLKNLKDFMEDTKRFYGFEIVATKVEDTSYFFMTRTVTKGLEWQTLGKLMEELLAIAEKKEAGHNGVKIFYMLPEEKEVKVFASIGVTKQVFPTSTDIFEYKRMPFGKNLLMSSYQGKMKEAFKVLKAHERFKNDRTLVSMAIPFQRILSDGLYFKEDDWVQLKIYSPVF